MTKVQKWLSALVEITTWLALVVAPTQWTLDALREHVPILESARVSLADPLIWIAAGCLVLATLLKREWHALLPPLWTGVAFCVVAIASMINVIQNPDFPRSVATMGARIEGVKEIVQFFEYFLLLPFLLKSLLAKRGRRSAVFGLMVFQFMVIVFLGYTQLRAEDPLLVTGTFSSRNVMGGYLALIMPLIMGVLLYSHIGLFIPAFIILVLMAFGPCFSGGSLIAMSCMLLAMSMARGVRYFFAMAAMLMVWHGIIVYSPSRDPITVRYKPIESIMVYDGGTATPRYPEWDAAANAYQYFPWLGVGPGQYQTTIGQCYGMTPPDETGAEEPDTENLWLVILASLGGLGLAAFCGVLLEGIRGGLRGVAYGNGVMQRGVALGVCGSLGAFSISAIWSPLLVRGIGVLLVTIIMLGVTSMPRRKAE